MDPIKNPFCPGADSPPPELVGRAGVIEQARVLLGRVKEGRPEKSILLTGLRGVGKTVLLLEIERLARAVGYRTILAEAHEEKPLAALLVPHLKKLFLELNRLAGVRDKARRGLAVLMSFLNAFKVEVGEMDFGLHIDPERGTADSGDLENDLPSLFVAVAEAAEERHSPVALLIDEIQYFSKREFGALTMAMHRMQQRQLPLVLVGAGLPILPRLAGESKSYSERLFSFPEIGPLSEADSARALQDPVRAAGVVLDARQSTYLEAPYYKPPPQGTEQPAKAVDVVFEEEALTEIFRLTHGYPYFLQEWGYQSWNQAVTLPIMLPDVKEATPEVIRRLDENFFRVRFERLAPGEKRFLRAMAECGSGTHRTGDIAGVLGAKITSLGPVRANLVRKGMIYSPAHGEIAFTVPLFDEFMRRAVPKLELHF